MGKWWPVKLSAIFVIVITPRVNLEVNFIPELHRKKLKWAACPDNVGGCATIPHPIPFIAALRLRD